MGRFIAPAAGDDNPYSAVLFRLWAVPGLLFMGDLDTARPHALAVLTLAARLRDRSWLANALGLGMDQTLEEPDHPSAILEPRRPI